MLTDSRILQAIRERQIIIDPFHPQHLGSNSYDLHIGPNLVVYDDPVLDAKKVNSTLHLTIPEEGFKLQPGELYLGATVEHTHQDVRLIPSIEGKSSVARLGICVHLTAGFGDIGFSGHWTLEITCVKPVIIYANMPICQIFWVEAVGHCNRPYFAKHDAKYNGQNLNPVPVPSAMWRNFQKS